MNRLRLHPYYLVCPTFSGHGYCPAPGSIGCSKRMKQEISLPRRGAGCSRILFIDGKRLTLGSYMLLDCFRLVSQPIELSSSPICYMEVLYSGGGARAPFEDVFPLKQGE